MGKLRLLILGTDEIWSIDKLYYNHLKKSDVEVNFFATENIFAAFYNHSIVNKVIFKLSLSSIYEKIQKETIKAIDLHKPDIIWVFKGMSLKPALLQHIKKLGIMLVNYNADNPFIFSGAGSGNANITNAIGLYDMHLTYNLDVQKKIAQDYHIKTGYLPFGYEISQAIIDEPIEEVNKLCFIGNPDGYRAKLIEELLNNNLKMDVFGHNWGKYIRHKNLTTYDAVYGDNLWRTLRKYRLQLNIMRVHNLNSHNMRSFEVPCSGTIMIAPDTEEHRLFFEDKKEVFLYSDLTHCAEITTNVLALSAEDANKIRENAKKRGISSKYSYADRAIEALNMIKNSYEG